MPLVDRPPYYISTAVFLSEVIKLVTSLSLALYDIARDPHTLDDLTVTGLFTKLGQVVFTSDSWKMALPAIPYTLQTDHSAVHRSQQSGCCDLPGAESA